MRSEPPYFNTGKGCGWEKVTFITSKNTVWPLEWERLKRLNLKVVLLHDWLTGFRGGERVLEVFAEMFPKAPIYTLIHVPGTCGDVIESREIKQSFLGSMPGIDKNYRKFLPLFPRAAESLRITENADLVLSSHHCVIKGVRKPKRAKHLCYVHSPMRYLYDQYDAYFGPQAPRLQRIGMKVFRGYLTKWDQLSCANVDRMLANSEFVKERIGRVWQNDSTVVHPFVELRDFLSWQKSPKGKEDFYLMVTAFAPNKRVDLAVTAFNKLGKKLVIIGSGQEEERLKAMAGPTIHFAGNLSREEVIDHFLRTRALIFPGVEDFGITPLESLAAGTPVIAFKTGGVLETLNESVAEFFSEPTVESLIGAVSRFEIKDFQNEALYQRANDFSRDTFVKNIEKQVEEVLK